MDDTTIRTLGLDPEQYDRIAQFVRSNARTKKFMSFDRVVDLKQLAGEDFDLLKGFIDRGVRTRIQDVPTRGDFHDAAFSFLGKVFTQFRTYSLKSIDNFLLQNASRLMHGDAAARMQVAQEVFAAMLTGSMIYYARNWVQYKTAEATDDKEGMERYEKMLGVEGFIKGGLSSAGEFYVPGLIADSTMEHIVDPMAQGFGLKDTALNRPLFSPYEFGQTGLLGTPAASYIRSFGKVAKDVMKQDINQSTVHNFRLLFPTQNIPGMASFMSLGEKEIADQFDLAKRSGMKK
jgi:hypothetical protein